MGSGAAHRAGLAQNGAGAPSDGAPAARGDHRAHARRPVFDFGQNMVGWVRLRGRGRAGTRVSSASPRCWSRRHAVPHEPAHGPAAPTPTSFAGTAGGLRAALHLPRLPLCRGTGYPGERRDLVGRVVHSASPRTAGSMLDDWSTSCGATSSGASAATSSVPTDCPQRDERLGWMGDTRSSAQRGVEHGCRRVLHQVARDPRRAARRRRVPRLRAAGSAPSVTARPPGATPGSSCPGVYRRYGDRRMLERH